jgi:autotransporter passenger strand-loop-strand repeat protein
LPRLPSDGCLVARAFRATGALSKLDRGAPKACSCQSIDWGTARGTTVNSGGEQDGQPGGIARGTTINNSGIDTWGVPVSRAARQSILEAWKSRFWRAATVLQPPWRSDFSVIPGFSDESSIRDTKEKARPSSHREGRAYYGADAQASAIASRRLDRWPRRPSIPPRSHPSPARAGSPRSEAAQITPDLHRLDRTSLPGAPIRSPLDTGTDRWWRSGGDMIPAIVPTRWRKHLK